MIAYGDGPIARLPIWRRFLSLGPTNASNGVGIGVGVGMEATVGLDFELGGRRQSGGGEATKPITKNNQLEMKGRKSRHWLVAAALVASATPRPLGCASQYGEGQ